MGMLGMIVILAWMACAEQARPAADLPDPTDPIAIIKKAVEANERNWKVARNYTWTERDEERGLDSQGGVKKTEVNTYEVTLQEGEPYYHLVQKNDKPLSPKEEKKEQEKLQKSIHERESETPEQRAKRLAKYEKEREESRKFLREITDAYTFRLEGEESIEGRPAWVIAAEPRPGFQPQMRDARILPKLHGKLWIDQQEYQWAKVEIEVIDTISFGLSLVRIHQGAHVKFEATRLNEEVWLPKTTYVAGSARVAYLKNLREDETTTYRDYKKFQVESRVVTAGEVPQ
jgi:hypothetical protein